VSTTSDHKGAGSTTSNDVEDRFGGQVESRLRLGRDAIGQVSQKRSPPEVAELVGDEFADIDGAGFQFEGGSVSGEMTSPMLENTVRNQGRRKRSPSKRPISTGLEVSCRGGSFSGAKVSRRLPASDLQSGCVRPGGGAVERNLYRRCGLRVGIPGFGGVGAVWHKGRKESKTCSCHVRCGNEVCHAQIDGRSRRNAV